MFFFFQRMTAYDVRISDWSSDVCSSDLCGGAVIEGRYALLSGQPVAEDAAADWQRIEGMVAHFLSFDTRLFSTPMWNFGIPYRLKHYIDLLTQPGLAFSADAGGSVIGHAAGRARKSGV